MAGGGGPGSGLMSEVPVAASVGVGSGAGSVAVGSVAWVTVWLLVLVVVCAAVLVGASGGALVAAGLLLVGSGLADGVGLADVVGAALASSDTVRTCWAGCSAPEVRETAVTPPITPAAASAAKPTVRRLLSFWVTSSSVPRRCNETRHSSDHV